MLLSGLPNGEWHDLNVFRKVRGSREIGVAVYEDAADDEYGIVRRRYLLRAARHLSFPVRTRNEVVARLRTSGARAHVGKVDVKRISELHAVVAAGDVRHVEDERPFGEVEPADGKEGVVVHADGH